MSNKLKEYECDLVGKHKLVTVGQIKDLKGNIVKQDIIYTDINVTE